MTLVTAQMSVSLDGYYAGPRGDDETFDLQSWLEGPEAAGFFRVTRWAIDAEAWRQRLGFSGGEQNVNSEIIAETFDSVGAYVMGRRMADGGEIPWGAEPPFRAPVFVVTHRPRPTVHRQGGTSFTYVTDGIHSAIEQAREAARGQERRRRRRRHPAPPGNRARAARRARAAHRPGHARRRHAAARPPTRTRHLRRNRAHTGSRHRHRRRHTPPLPSARTPPSRAGQPRPRDEELLDIESGISLRARPTAEPIAAAWSVSAASVIWHESDTASRSDSLCRPREVPAASKGRDAVV